METISELEGYIRRIIRAYQDVHNRSNDFTNWMLFDPVDMMFYGARDSKLKEYAIEVRGCAIDLGFKIPTPQSDPLNDLMVVLQCCVEAQHISKTDGGIGTKPKGRTVTPTKIAAIDRLKELLGKDDFSDMPKERRSDAWNWLSGKINFSFSPSPDSEYSCGEALQRFLRSHDKKLHSKVKSLLNTNIGKK